MSDKTNTVVRWAVSRHETVAEYETLYQGLRAMVALTLFTTLATSLVKLFQSARFALRTGGGLWEVGGFLFASVVTYKTIGILWSRSVTER